MRRRAYAKVNLCLSVGPPEPGPGPRAGWHPIASWMHAIDLFDEIEARPAAMTRHEIRWREGIPWTTPIDWPIERDLLVRAHRALESHVGRELPTEITLIKSIPVGAGLGGGSSDAAAGLEAVADAHGIEMSIDDRRRLAMRLGSDVVFFVGAGGGPPAPAIVEGFGDRIGPAPGVGWELGLIVPRFGCPTPEVYAMYDRLGPARLDGGRVRRAAEGASAGLFNDLASASERVRPALAELRRRAARAVRRPVHVTGSGSAMFVILESPREVDLLSAALPEAWVTRTRLLGPEPGSGPGRGGGLE